MPKPPRLGIIAGGGELPARLAAAAAAAGRNPFIVGIAGAVDTATLEGRPHVVVDVAAVGRTLQELRTAGAEDVVFAGPLRRPTFSSLRPDWQGMRLLPRVIAAARNGDDAIFKAVVAFIEEEGFRVVGAEDVLEDLLAPSGALGQRAPTAADRADIERAVAVVLALGALDVGQAAVVRDGVVLGVEAAEGTDALLERCGRLQPAGQGGVLVKFAKPGQERRVDLPTVGAATVRNAAAAGLNGIAVEAGGTLVLDRDAVARTADAAGLFVCGIARPGR